MAIAGWNKQKKVKKKDSYGFFIIHYGPIKVFMYFEPDLIFGSYRGPLKPWLRQDSSYSQDRNVTVLIPPAGDVDGYHRVYPLSCCMLIT